uniref:LYR motif containing 4 n=1 Tax=Equus asinus TaxID=9793 RepID=A0A9L0IRR6_EQUAS
NHNSVVRERWTSAQTCLLRIKLLLAVSGARELWLFVTSIFQNQGKCSAHTVTRTSSGFLPCAGSHHRDRNDNSVRHCKAAIEKTRSLPSKATGERTYAVRRIRDAFRENKNVKDPVEIQALVNKAKRDLEIIRRQTLFSCFLFAELIPRTFYNVNWL